MAMCAMCGRRGPWDECPKCKPNDRKVERKFNKHDGKPPTSDRRPDPAFPDAQPKKWPAFKAGTKDDQDRAQERMDRAGD